MDKIKKELDDFIEIVLAYAKKHNLSYVIGVGKRIEEAQQTAVMDSWWSAHEGDIEAITQAFCKSGGAIPACIAMGIVAEAKELAKKTKH